LGGNRVGQSTASTQSDINKQFGSDTAKLSNSIHDTASRQVDQDADPATATEGQQFLSPKLSPTTVNQQNTSSSSSRWIWLSMILRRALNIFVVFTFVAFWHDRELKLIAWGWLIALLFLPELILRSVFNSNIPIIRHIYGAWYYRHLKASAAAACIWMMMVANLVGYSVGVGGTYHIVNKFFDEGGITMCIMSFAVFFSAAQLMFAVRQDEEYHRSVSGQRAVHD
jgi:hypothetical protein